MARSTATFRSGNIHNGSCEAGSGSTTLDQTFIGGESFGWFYRNNNGSGIATVSYDTSVKYSGSQSLKIITISAGLAYITTAPMNNSNGEIILSRHDKVIPIKASTAYTFTAYGKFDAGTHIRLMALRYSLSGVIYSYSSNTNIIDEAIGDWRLITASFTSGASEVGFVGYLGFSADGASQTAYFDQISLSPIYLRTTAVARNVASARNPVV